jgi:hypothetical protein
MDDMDDAASQLNAPLFYARPGIESTITFVSEKKRTLLPSELQLAFQYSASLRDNVISRWPERNMTDFEVSLVKRELYRTNIPSYEIEAKVLQAFTVLSELPTN